jgi:hexulose-6-phosphate isomerase
MTASDDYLSSYADAGLYTMQGRLSPPEDGRFQCFPKAHWESEIDLASEVPFRGIEWIFDLYGEGANPLETQARRAALKAKLERTRVNVVSICADYFMDCPLVGVEAGLLKARIAKLKWLISICPELGIARIVLPFVDASRISSCKDSDDVLYVLHEVLMQAAQNRVELHLETDLSPHNFKSFLNEVEHSLVKVNYDSGNSGSLGYKPTEEFAAYGHRIGSVHIKDRTLGGGTVRLGTGVVDFSALRNALVDIDYRGDFVLQVARGVPGDELQWNRRTVAIVNRWLRGESVLN